MNKYVISAILIAIIGYFEPYMFAIMGTAIAMTVLFVYLLNRGMSTLSKLLSENHIVNILLVNFFALLVSAFILILSSYLGRYLNTHLLQIAMPQHGSQSPILALWVPFILIGNYFFLVFIMTAQLLETNN